VDIMKKQRKQKAEQTITLRLWTFGGARKAVPYLRSLVQSLRDDWLELRQCQEKIARLEARPGRTDRDVLILLDDSRRDLQRAQAKLEETVEEMVAISAYGVDPAAGLAVVPFFHDNTLAWLVFDLFDPQGLAGWRLHSDPLETRRLLSDLDESTATRGIGGDTATV
jgi:hypothetical protein